MTLFTPYITKQDYAAFSSKAKVRVLANNTNYCSSFQVYDFWKNLKTSKTENYILSILVRLHMFLPVDEKQFEFWVLRRNGLPNINIAKQFRISRQAVSRALLSMDKRIEETLLEMARANRIEVEKFDLKKGILFGRSVPFKANAIIFVSAKHGIQVWYEHEGECGSCERYQECIELLWDFAEEMKLKLQSTEDPTKIADELFRKLKELVEQA